MEKLLKKDSAKFIYLEQILYNIKDNNVPLSKKLKFIKLFADKLNEFIEDETSSNKKSKTKKKKDPAKDFKSLYKKISIIDEEFEEVYNDSVIPELEKNKIFIKDRSSLNEEQLRSINELFEKQFKPVLNPYSINKDSIESFFKNGQSYFVLKTQRTVNETAKDDNSNEDESESAEALPSYEYILIEIAGSLPKFIRLDSEDFEIMTLNEIIRANFDKLLPGHEISEAHFITFYSADKKNSEWVLFADKNIPGDFLKDIRKLFKIKKKNIFSEPAYININYLIAYIGSNFNSYSEELKPIEIDIFNKSANMFEAILQQDVLLCYPFHPEKYALNFLRQASDDPFVSEIRLTESQLTQESNTIIALLNAIKTGKRVSIYTDDDGNALNDFRESGINVIINSTGMELNSEIIMVRRRENDGEKNYVYFSTRNLSKKNIPATNLGLFTCDDAVAEDSNYFFNFLQLGTKGFEFNELMVSELNMKKGLSKLIANEVKNSKEGKDGYIMIKLNKFEDKKLAGSLLKASESGVRIKILVSESCLLGQQELQDPNIQLKYLINIIQEHSRIIIFYNDGEPLIYISSGDWTKEDLSNKISIAFPVKQTNLRTQLVEMINLYSRSTQAAVYNYLKLNDQ